MPTSTVLGDCATCRVAPHRPTSARFRCQLSLALVAGLLTALPATTAWGWGSGGHRRITASAPAHLPLPLRGFFNANISEIVSIAGGEPRLGLHYIDIDVYPEFLAGTFPRDHAAAVAKYGASTLASYGEGPWTYDGLVAQLTQQMAAAQTPADWDDLVYTAAAAAHYIEDLTEPLHTTKNYDGEDTDNDGIHSRYETTMVNQHASDLTFDSAPAVYLPSVLDFAFDGIEDRYHYVAEIMAADTAAQPAKDNPLYYPSLWASTGTFTKQLFKDASLAVASTWYTAWVNAGSPRTFLTHSADFDGDGDVDAADLAAFRPAYGATSVADSNADGQSDGVDFLAWQRQRGGASATPAGTSVPEPGTIVLLGAAILAVAARRTGFPRMA